tara:strand:- start:179 stop:352 length:174 start_codon:yes stop_codon:yes gene_type:complete
MKEWLKEIPNWEQEYNAMSVERSKREQEILDGDDIKSHEGMVYGRMYADWKRIKGYE